MANATPNKEALLDLFRRLVHEDYYTNVAADPSYAIFRALAIAHSTVAEKAITSIQARYYLPYPTQLRPPASGPQKARFTAALKRTANLHTGTEIAAGQMLVRALGNRRYTNEQEIRWYPNDPPEKTITTSFICEVPGFLGNLDFLADDSGGLPLDHIQVDNQSQERANTGGTIFHEGGAAYLRDSGVPDVFLPSDVGLYVQITNAPSGANVNEIRKIKGWEWPKTEIPPGSGRYPTQVQLEEHFAGVPGEVLLEDFGTGYTDYTAEALSDSGTPVPLLPSPRGVSDALYILASNTLSGVWLDGFTAVDAVNSSLIAEYFDGSSWVEFPTFIDPSAGYTLTADRWLLEWSIDGPVFSPYTSPVTGVQWGYAVRLRQTIGTAVVDAPTASRIVPRIYKPLTDTASVTWSLHDWKDEGPKISIVSSGAPSGGRDDDLYILGDNRGVYRQANETDDSFRNRAARLADTVSPNAVRRAVNRLLEPYGYVGAAIDVQLTQALPQPCAPLGGFEGHFYDFDAYDYYAPEAGHSTARTVATSSVTKSGTPTINGVATLVGDIVLLTAQGVDNGAWVVAAGAWSRDATWGFAPTPPGVDRKAGAYATAISEGTFAGSSYVCTNLDPSDRVGVDSLSFTVDAEQFPESPWRLPLSGNEAYGHAFILVPYMGDGDFGMFFDEGPRLRLDQDASYTGPAYDSGFLDGVPSDALGVYQAISDAVESLLAGGVFFTLIRKEDLTIL